MPAQLHITVTGCFSEIARNFLERTGNHIVISGIVSPVHDYYGNCSLIPSSHRLVMCQAAVKSHSWLR